MFTQRDVFLLDTNLTNADDIILGPCNFVNKDCIL